MANDAPRRERGVRYWLDLMEQPCPGCGLMGGEGTERNGALCRDHHLGIDFILCESCAATVQSGAAQLTVLDRRISAALAQRRE